MNVEPSVPPAPAVCEIQCNVTTSAKQNWDCCDLKQFCAKLDSINESAARGKTTTDPAKIQERNSRRGEALFRQRWNEAPLAWQPIQHKFYHPCAFQKARANDFQMNGQDWNPDHVHDIQFGGNPTDFKNLKWLSSSVNKSLGQTLTPYNPDIHSGGVSADCCPAEDNYCPPGKDDSANILAEFEA
jgi:hypothetical protein